MTGYGPNNKFDRPKELTTNTSVYPKCPHPEYVAVNRFREYLARERAVEAGMVETPPPASIDLSSGTKDDGDKPEWDLLPLDMLEEVVRVLMYGKKKYAAWNWTKGIAYTRLLNATLRHIAAIQRGEDVDPETGLLHAAHAATNLLFLTHQMKHRWKQTTATDSKSYAHFDNRTDVGTPIPQNINED